MLWLFGQIWLWLLIAFLLGAAVMWLLMRATRPKPVAEPEVYEHDEAEDEPLDVPAPLEAERTQYIPPVGHYEYEEQPERVYNDYPQVDPDEPYEPEHRSDGRLPEPEARLSGDLGWPADAETTGGWERAGRPAPRRPGRGG
ncbi:LapA family protein [Amycolatopsis sp. PS_44_ISF1]|uniref:LapA family protein n=1 Tax=Amycolatopsis sp. PS_44_ISF1 TaxID=2974917 RepID=UPI0028DE36CB|nr:LapA family protein [Amycolatopsis sp. PS_44_ISF1]MDT8911063.1 LapA family protein [Amycolatopsis sp. PS_44_ISF1]